MEEFKLVKSSHVGKSKMSKEYITKSEAIEAKRKWLRGEISNYDLTAARAAAWAAAREHEVEILRELLEEGDK